MNDREPYPFFDDEDPPSLSDIHQSLEAIRMETETAANALTSINTNLYWIGMMMGLMIFDMIFGFREFFTSIGWA